MRWPWETKESIEPYRVGIAEDPNTAARIDVFSPTWIFLDRWMHDELQRLRRANDSAKLTETKTNFLRGRIHEIKSILNLPNKKEKGILNK